MENIKTRDFSKINEFNELTKRIPFTARYVPFNLEDFLHFKKKVREYALASEIWLETKDEETKESCERIMQMVQILKWKDYKTYSRPLIFKN